jgi:hypothetical protein
VKFGKKKSPFAGGLGWTGLVYYLDNILSLTGLRVEPQPIPNAGLISQPLCFFISLYFIQKYSPAFSPPRNLQELFDKLVGSPKTHGAC